MRCINCGNNVSIEKETSCSVCGIRYPIKCDVCKEPNPLYSNYCCNCGVPLGSKNQSQVSNFDTLVEARKKVAVIFADISGFTALSENLDPEEVRDLINECFAYITKPVYELEGTIDKYIGDCVMILFGAKYSHTDDARRAVECGLKMLERIKEYSAQKLYHKNFELNISIGINYGVVVTGKVGNLYDKDFTVMGDIVNTAQRLQTAAEVGQLLVSRDCFNETNDYVEYSEAKEINVKNKQHPVVCYNAFGMKKDVAKNIDVLYDRDKQLETMAKLYMDMNCDRYISIIGEAGIGKSSLAMFFCDNYTDSSVKKHLVNCSLTNKNRVYGVVTNLILSIAGLSVNDSTRIMAKELKSYLKFLLKDKNAEEIEKNFNFIGLVIGLERNDEFNKVLKSMDYEDIKREIDEQLQLFFSNIFKQREYVFVIDDAQWADTDSVRILKSNICKSKLGRSLLVMISQNEIEEFNALLNTISLGALETSGIKALVNSIFETSDINDDFLDSITRFSQGNPLYVKEYVYAIKRKNNYMVKNSCVSINKNMTQDIPTNIENAILSSISELNEDNMTALQVAACVGKEFKVSLISEILNRNIDEIDFVEKLKSLNIVSLNEVIVTTESISKIYMFKQDITRKVILEGILIKHRVKYYKRLAEVIERHYFNEIENHYAELYLYYKAARVEFKTCEYALKAAINFKNNYNYTSAIEYYLAYIGIVQKNIDENNASSLATAYMDVGTVYNVIGEDDMALEYFGKALDLFKSPEDVYAIKLMEVEIYRNKAEFDKAMEIIDEIKARIRTNSSIYGKLLRLQCTIMKMQGKHDILQLALSSEEILIRTKDFENLSETQSLTGLLYFFDGEIELASYYLMKAYENAEQTSNLNLIAKVAGNLGIVYHASGRTSKAIEFFNKAVEISEKISNIQNYISASMNLGKAHMEKGSFDKAESYIVIALDKSKQTDSVYANAVILMNYGDLMYIRGNYEKTESLYSEALTLVEKFEINGEKAVNLLNIIKLKLKLGKLDESNEILLKVFELIEETKQADDYVEYYRLKSILAFHKGELTQAVSHCDKAIQYAIESNNDMKRLRALRFKAVIDLELGNYMQAFEHLKESFKLSEQLESEYESAKDCYYLAKVLKQLDKQEEAQYYKKLAMEYASKIDECIWKYRLKDE